MTDKDIAEYALRRLTCTIQAAVAKEIAISKNPGYRVIPRAHGFTTSYWAYRPARAGRIHAHYAIDTIIVGTQVDIDCHQTFSVSKALMLPSKHLASSIDYGFQGYDYGDCEVNTALSKLLFNVGRDLRKKFDHLLAR